MSEKNIVRKVLEEKQQKYGWPVETEEVAEAAEALAEDMLSEEETSEMTEASDVEAAPEEPVFEEESEDSADSAAEEESTEETGEESEAESEEESEEESEAESEEETEEESEEAESLEPFEEEQVDEAASEEPSEEEQVDEAEPEEAAEEAAEEAEIEEDSVEEASEETESEEASDAEVSDEEPASEEQETDPAAEEKKQKRRKALKITIAVLAVLVIIGGAWTYYAFSATTFANRVAINGTDVSGMDTKEAAAALTESMNDLSVTIDDTEKEIHTAFAFDNESSLKDLMRKSTADPRHFFTTVDYDMGMNVADGIEASAKVLAKNFPDASGTVLTSNARIDYDKMVIIPEKQGKSTNYIKIAEEIGDGLGKSPAEKEFTFKRADYIETPTVKAADLEEELAFAKEYLTKPFYVNNPRGMLLKLKPAQLAEIVLYSEDGPKYSLEGAEKVVKELKAYYGAPVMTVQTTVGEKELNNYVISGEINEKESANAIYKALKNGKTSAKLSVKDQTSQDVMNQVEINLSSQNVKFVRNGEVIWSAPCVTGGPGYRTPTGIFNINYKTMNTVLKGKNADGTDYESPVRYWMPFNGGIGLHDADWRSAFGGGIYINDGSHGCINLPPSLAGGLYNLINSGTLVYVYF